MRRAFYPPLSTSKAVKLSELNKSQNKKKQKKTPSSHNTSSIPLSNDQQSLEKQSVTQLIQIYQDLYDRFEKGLQEQSKLESLRLQIIDEIDSIKRQTAEIEQEMPQNSTNSDLIDFSPIIRKC